jgi:hypothetical protein
VRLWIWNRLADMCLVLARFHRKRASLADAMYEDCVDRISRRLSDGHTERGK